MEDRRLLNVEGGKGDHDPLYLRFSSEPVALTKAFARGEVMLDLSETGEVIGIEMLNTDPDVFEVVAKLAAQHHLKLLPHLLPARSA